MVKPVTEQAFELNCLGRLLLVAHTPRTPVRSECGASGTLSRLLEGVPNPRLGEVCPALPSQPCALAEATVCTLPRPEEGVDAPDTVPFAVAKNALSAVAVVALGVIVICMVVSAA